MRITGISIAIGAFIRALGTSTVPTAGEGLLGVSLEDRNGNPALLVDNQARNISQSGLPIGGINDGTFKLVRLDRSGGQASANLTPLFHEPFDGTALNTLRWTPTNVTYAPTIGPLGYNFNPANSLGASASAILISNLKFLKTQRNPFYNKWRARWLKIANSQGEFGFGIPIGSAVPPNGVFWRLVGNLAYGVVTINSTEYSSDVIDITTLVNSNNYYTFDIFMDDDDVKFSILDTGTGLITKTGVRLDSTQFRMFGNSRLPLFSRLFTGAIAPLSVPNLFISDCFLGSSDLTINRSYDDFLSSIGYAAYANPLTGVQNLTYTNSAEPANAILSNIAPSYASLGGKFQFAAPAGAVTDYLLFALQIPDPVELKIKMIKISAKSVVAAVTTAATELEWFIVTNMATASLAAAGAIRIPLGLQLLPITTSVVSMAGDIVVDFQNMPIRCNSGRFIGFGVRVPGGAATASQIIKGIITPIGTME